MDNLRIDKRTFHTCNTRGNHHPITRGASSDNTFNERPDNAAIASLSEKESDIILAATFITRKITLNFMRLATVGTAPPTRNITAEYVIIKKSVSVIA